MKYLFKFPSLIIIVIVVITILLALPIPTLQIDNDTTKFLPESNPERAAYKNIEDQYGENMMMAVSIKFKKGYLYSKDNLELIKQLTEEFEKLPTLEKVTSVVNVDYIVGTEDGIETTKLIENMPENEEEENKIKEKLLSWEMYKNFFSEDFTATMIALKLNLGIKNKNAEESYKQVKEILKRYKNDDYEFYIAGLPTVLVLIANNMRKDLAKLVPFVVIILILTLLVSFRRVGGIALPTLTVLITTVCTLGIMAIFKINLTMIASAIPVLMIAVGSAYGIHIISHYYDEIDKEKLLNKTISEERNREIIFDTIKRIGGAVLLAALTTMAGFGSLATSKIVPIKEFGIFTSIGVLIAFLTSLTLIPSLLLVRHKALKAKIKKENDENNKKLDILTKALFIMYKFLSKGKIRVIILFGIILLIAIFGTTRIIVGNPMINYFKKDTEIRKADSFANKNFNGTTIITMVIKGENPGDLTDPDILIKLDNLQKYLKKKYKDIGNIISFTELIKKMNQVMNADEVGNYYEIPYDPVKYKCQDKMELKQLIAQYLLLFSGNLKEYVDDSIEPSQTKVDILLKNPDFDLVRKIEKDILDYAKNNFPENYKVVISGNAKLQVVVSNLIIDSQITNIIFSLIAVFLILTLYYKSGIAGIFGVITLSIPIFLNFGVMGFLKIRLDAGTSMVASVAIGIGIDYTIHFMNAYHHERKKSNDLNTVTTNALLSCGKAIIFNAASVGLGFLVLVFSSFMPLIYFGALLAFTMLTASLSSMTLLPVMLNIFKPKFIAR
ncbi:MAG TPA: MMPL family transporter [Spirochaetota bacterium]|nr:MMPL family transporter [Spirochaetota bacterium]HOL58136.1 MMPL family transporter [Spirochaetota bacterium]HPP05597.1 MMPL family transporter [Spirochaetota bacterium]